MRAETWARIREVFEEVRDLDGADRERRLSELASEDTRIEREVRALLESEEAATRALDDRFDGATLPEVGRRIGAYRALRLLGRGGMGEVWLAVRADEDFQVPVAVKVVRTDGASARQLELFRAEREILARLDHPCIARVFDGGETDEGSPFFVMEHVDGVSIDRFCDTRRLSVDERLDLFERVCGAVHFAHQNLVVHRDLKPGNILVTRDGTPKLLDFGIAKLLGGPSGVAGSPEAPATATRALTPEYASPEQFAGQSVTTATDVYSLGVLAYELLCGRRPFALQGLSLQDALWQVREEDPPPPSRALAHPPGRSEGFDAGESPEDVARRRSTSVATLQKRLSGDLSAVLSKCLHKDPAQRYASAEALVLDLQRERRGEPILARPDTLTYRTRKFVTRHRTGVAAALLLLLTLLGGMATTAWQARVAERERQRAERRFDDVRDLANALLFDLHDAIADVPGSTRARELLVTEALEYLDSLSREAEGDAELLAELASAYERVGDVQGWPRVPNLGDHAAARKSYAKARTIRDRLRAAGADSSELRSAEADLLFRLGDMEYWGGDTDAARALYERSAAIREAISSDAPESVEALRLLAESRSALGDLRVWVGEAEAAVRDFETAESLTRRALDEEPDSPSLREFLGSVLASQGNALSWAGESEAAVAHLERALELFDALAEEGSASARLTNQWINASRWKGESEMDLERTDAAIASFEGALAKAREQSKLDPDDRRMRRNISLLNAKIGDALVDERPVDALARYRAALAVQETLQEESPETTGLTMDLANSWKRIGGALAGAGRLEEALDAYDRSLESARELVVVDPGDTMARRLVGIAERDVGQLYQARAEESPGVRGAADRQRACRRFRAALEVYEELESTGRLPDFDASDLEELRTEVSACAAS